MVVDEEERDMEALHGEHTAKTAQGLNTRRMSSEQGYAPITKYPGSKHRLAPFILQFLPEHRVYLEPFLGSGAIFFHKAPAIHEVLNDLDGDVVNLFRMIRDHGEELADLIEYTPWAREEYTVLKSATPSDSPLENARRFLVRCWQAHGVRTDQFTGWRRVGPKGDAATVALWKQLPARLRHVIDRLRDAEIECTDALELIEAYGRYSHCAMFVDPPYIQTTRSNPYYKHEMNLDGHARLLETLDRCTCAVLLSGYAHPLYDERLAHWTRIGSNVQAEHGRARTEVLWLNAKAQRRQLSLFDEQGGIPA